jgi:hypothetical protein
MCNYSNVGQWKRQEEKNKRELRQRKDELDEGKEEGKQERLKKAIKKEIEGSEKNNKLDQRY